MAGVKIYDEHLRQVEHPQGAMATSSCFFQRSGIVLLDPTALIVDNYLKNCAKGLETWENVWSCWVQLTQGDGEAIRRGATILRYMGGKGFLQSADWEPHVETMSDGVYASMFPSGGEAVWHLINLAEEDVEGDLIALELPENTTLYDCYRGVPATTTKTSFLKHKSTNCYSGHGAIDIDVNGQRKLCLAVVSDLPCLDGSVSSSGCGFCFRHSSLAVPKSVFAESFMHRLCL